MTKPVQTHKIARRLIILIVAFSSFLTFLITGLQLLSDFRQQRADMEQQLEEVTVFLPSIAAGVWSFNEKQIGLALTALVNLPNIERVSVTANGGKSAWKAGEDSSDRVVTRTYPLMYEVRGAEQQIAVIEVVASLDAIYRRLISRAVAVLASNGVKTFLVAAFMMVIIRRVVTNRIERLANKVDELIPQLKLPSFHFDAQGGQAHGNEIDALERGFDGMAEQLKAAIADLQHAYDKLRIANAELELDIVARRKAEEEVNRLNAVLDQRVRQRTADLEAANKELAAFSYSVSHDLRAPLRRIEGFGRILVEEYSERLDERAIRYLDRMRAGSQEMGDMIDSFLKLSRATRGDLNLEALDLSKMAAEIAERLAEAMPERKVSVEIQPGLAVEGDPRLMRVVLENLIGNAWKYTRDREQPLIRFGTTENDGHPMFFVADNGAGFDMSLAKRLFTPFQRLHRPEEFEGTGIGLATVQRILARHGGRLWGEGALGVGATFTFSCWDGAEVDAGQLL